MMKAPADQPPEVLAGSAVNEIVAQLERGDQPLILVGKVGQAVLDPRVRAADVDAFTVTP